MSELEELFEEIPPGFIRDFTNTLMERLPGVNQDYIQMCAETTLAGVCYNIFHHNRVGKMNLGLWSLGITRSGGWKTVPIRNYSIPILSEVQKNLHTGGNFHKKILVPSRFSPEGLIEFMTVHKEPFFDENTEKEDYILTIYNEGVMIRDEFTGLMKGTKNKQWMTDVSEILSEVYDTSVQAYYTKKSKLQDVPYCNISFLMATTPHVYDIMDETFFAQGLGNRIDYVVFDPPKEAPRIDPDEFFGSSWVKEKDEAIGKFSRQLFGVLNSSCKFIGIDLSSNVGRLWADYRYEIELKKRDLPEKGVSSLFWSYLSRQAEKALRRAGIYCVSRNVKSVRRMKEIDTLILSEDDMRRAIERQKRHYRYFEIMLNRWLRQPSPRGGAKTDLVDLERMLSIIFDTPYKMISNPRWISEAGYGFQNKFYQLKATLILQGDVRELSEEEMKSLTKVQKGWLGSKHGRVKVYRLTDKYFKERAITNPFKC